MAETNDRIAEPDTQDTDTRDSIPDLVDSNDDVINFEDLVKTDDPNTSLLSNTSTNSTKCPAEVMIDERKVAKTKYKRTAPNLVKPYHQELLMQMNGSVNRLFKFIDDSGHHSDQSLMQFFELEKRVVKIPRMNKKGKMKQVKLTTEEKAELKVGETEASCKWFQSESSGEPVFFPGIVTEPKVLRLTEKEHEFSDTAFNATEIATLKKITKQPFQQRDDFVQNLIVEVKKRARYGAYTGVTITDEKPKEPAKFLDKFFGKSKIIPRCSQADYEDDQDEFIQMLYDLDFPNPSQYGTDKTFIENYEKLIESEHARFQSGNYEKSDEFQKLLQNILDPTLAAMNLE